MIAAYAETHELRRQRMRAITLNEPDTQPAAREDLPAPTPTDNEVLVRVHGSSVNPVDGSIAAGLLSSMGVEHEYPSPSGATTSAPSRRPALPSPASRRATRSSVSCSMPTQPSATGPGPN